MSKQLKVYSVCPIVKNLMGGKYKKHEVWLDDTSSIDDDRLESICVLEQGIDLVKNKLSKTEEEKEYVTLKVYFKKS